MNRLILFCVLAFIVASCQPKSSDADQVESAVTESSPVENTTKAPAPTTPTATVSYPSVPLDTLTMLWEKCDYIDFVFYNFNFSMSQHEKEGIQSTLRHIAEQTPVINDSCKPIGRIFFQVEGRNALEGDFFIGNGCLYYIFYENGKKTYANLMTEMGKNFFANIFAQMKNSQQQTQ